MTTKFRTEFGAEIFKNKYRNDKGGCDTWPNLAYTLVHRVCAGLMPPGDMSQLARYVAEMKFIPAGRYLYYAGRDAMFFNNCFGFKAEDSREGWAELGGNHFRALMVGGGCGTYYGDVRAKGEIITRTGGVASGPVPLMYAMNEIGRNVQQGGSRRSALYASLPWDHKDIWEFMWAKNWTPEQITGKAGDFNFPAPLDMTNISIGYDSQEGLNSEVFLENVIQACKTGEPGFMFNFNAWLEVVRNACAEFISEYDSDCCNLGSLNFSRIKDKEELIQVTELAAKFLVCGSIRSELPYEKAYRTREDHRKIGLGLMGVHEWLLTRGERYELTNELTEWLQLYEYHSKHAADIQSYKAGVSTCERYRSVAPAGTISILAGTTSGIEPLYAVGTKRRYLEGNEWKHQYIVEPFAEELISRGIDPDAIETSRDLAKDIRRRLEFQAGVQKYVDMGISSTINLPEWGSEYNCIQTIDATANLIREFAPQLRGLTFYPDGSRGGQPLVTVSYAEAKEKSGHTFKENLEFLETVSCPSGACGI
jgi:ribonucleoside-diphosphate reductase alpha chain